MSDHLACVTFLHQFSVVYRPFHYFFPQMSNRHPTLKTIHHILNQTQNLRFHQLVSSLPEIASLLPSTSVASIKKADSSHTEDDSDIGMSLRTIVTCKSIIIRTIELEIEKGDYFSQNRNESDKEMDSPVSAIDHTMSEPALISRIVADKSEAWIPITRIVSQRAILSRPRK